MPPREQKIMDPDFDARRPDMLAKVVAWTCLTLGAGAIGLAVWVYCGEIRQRLRWWRIGR